MCVRVYVCVCSVPQLRLILVSPWTAAHQAPPPMGFSRQDYWSGLPFPSPGDLPNQGIKPGLLRLLHWHKHTHEHFYLSL